MKSFTIFTSSATVDHIILYYFPQHRCTWGTETAFKIKKQK